MLLQIVIPTPLVVVLCFFFSAAGWWFVSKFVQEVQYLLLRERVAKKIMSGQMGITAVVDDLTQYHKGSKAGN